MSKLPEGRQPLSWQDMPFADRPRGHPSTWEAETKALRAKVQSLEEQIETEKLLKEAFKADYLELHEENADLYERVSVLEAACCGILVTVAKHPGTLAKKCHEIAFEPFRDGGDSK